MIVEDEAILRQGIVSLIDWKALNCTVVAACENPIAALSFLKTHSVDLIISDIRMPQMDGIAFAEQLGKTNPEIAFIILSAYSDFSYVQKAVELKNVMNYTLKSNFVKDLPAVLETVLSRLRMQQLPANLNDQQKQHYMLEILEGRQTDSAFIHAFFDTYLLSPQHYYVILQEVVLEEAEFSYGPASSSNYTDFLHNVQNFINMSFQDLAHVTMTLSSSLILTLVTFDSDDETEHSNQLLRLCSDLLATVQEYMSFGLSIAISTQHSDLQELAAAYEEARTALAAACSNDCISFSDRADAGAVAAPMQLLDETNALVRAIVKKDLPGVDALCRQLFSRFEAAGVRGSAMCFKLNQLLSSSLMLLSNQGIRVRHLYEIQQKFLQAILETHSSFYMQKMFVSTLTSLVENLGEEPRTYSQLVCKTNAYIETHYRQNIRLEDLAQQICVSPSYLSRIYKTETGSPITTYINHIRIQKAKELLRQESPYISEIAFQVGYQDPAYFTKVFTKFEGCSPTAYHRSCFHGK